MNWTSYVLGIATAFGVSGLLVFLWLALTSRSSRVEPTAGADDPGRSVESTMWRHADGTVCVAGHDDLLDCAEGGGPVHRAYRSETPPR